MILKTLFALPLVAQLAGCGVTETIKDTVYKRGADIGNDYCETRDGELRDSAVARINRGLRAEGAEFDFLGIECDAEAPEVMS